MVKEVVFLKPKYEEIANILRERIDSGVYAEDTLLPNQTELVTEFDASRMTIKKAIDLLMMEGRVYARRGAGTKVLNRSFWNKDTSPVGEYDGLSKQMAAKHKTLTSKVICFEVMFPSAEVQQRLMIQAQQPVYKLIRLRILEGIPYLIEHTYMPCDLVPGLTTEILLHSIYDYVKGELGLQFGGAYRSIQADRSDTYDQEYLSCALEDPVLEVEQVVYLKDGRPLEYSKSRNRFDVRGYSMSSVDA